MFLPSVEEKSCCVHVGLEEKGSSVNSTNLQGELSSQRINGSDMHNKRSQNSQLSYMLAEWKAVT